MKHIVRLLALLLCLMTFTATALAYPAGFRVYNGDKEQKRIAITVDDLYSSNVMQLMHDLSVELDFPITWFALGLTLRDEDKELWESILAHGDEIGNHTWSHPNLTKVNRRTVRNQVLLTQERIDELLGYHYPLRLLRPPYGTYNTEVLDVCYDHGIEKAILWNVSNIDPKKAFHATQNGSILLYHTNIADYHCLVELVPMLKEAGFELVTVSELIGLDPIETSEEKYIFPYR